MITFVFRKLFLLLVTLLILVGLSYWLAFLLPGDPLANLSGVPVETEAMRQVLREKYFFDASVFTQLWNYLGLLFEGDWGFSFASDAPMLSELQLALPASIELAVYALSLSLLVGIPLGLVAGLQQHKWPDAGILSLSLLGYSVPVFWLALILILVFALQLGWFPLSGRISLLYDIPASSGFIFYDIWVSTLTDKGTATRDAIQHLILPTLSIAIMSTTIIVRITRRSMMEVMETDYIQAAYGRGLSNRQVFWKHALRNALIPVLPTLFLQFNTLLTSAMIVETIFSWPGVGNWLLQAIAQRDYPVIRGGMLAVSCLVMVFSIVMEIVLRYIDPVKGKYQYAPF